MSVRISHQAYLLEKRYQSSAGIVFLKVGTWGLLLVAIKITEHLVGNGVRRIFCVCV